MSDMLNMALPICCICFESSDLWTDETGQTWNVCVDCQRVEAEYVSEHPGSPVATTSSARANPKQAGAGVPPGERGGHG